MTNTTGDNLSSDIISSLIAAITGSPNTSNLTKNNTAGISADLNDGGNSIHSVTSPDNLNPGGTNPKAYMTILFFDERFSFVGEGSTSLRVTNQNNSNAVLGFANIKAPNNGYAYVYLSNESTEPVYFDNFNVQDNRGRLIEEDHYYAYGLKIASISSKKLGDPNEGWLENKNLYNNKELIDEADLNWYDYGFRSYDPQIGRFTQLDPLTDGYAHYTPYQYAGNEPIANVDVDGLEPYDVIGYVGDAVVTSQSVLKEIVVVGVKQSVPKLSSYALSTAFSLTVKGIDLEYKIDHTFVSRSIYDPNISLPPHNYGIGSHQTAGLYLYGGASSSDNYSDHADYQYDPIDMGTLLGGFKSVGLNRNVAWEWWHKPNLLHTLELANGVAEVSHLLHEEGENFVSNSTYADISYKAITPKITVTKNINLGTSHYEYYDRKKGISSYKSGEADSMVHGKNDAPDTNFIRHYSRPKMPKYDIPRK